MITKRVRIRMCVGATVGLMTGSVLWASATAVAGVTPPVIEMDVEIINETSGMSIFDDTIFPDKTGPFGPSGSEAWSYNVSLFNPSFSLTGEVNASPTLPQPTPAFLSSTLNFANTSSDFLTFLVTLRLPIDQAFNAPLEWSSAASWTLTGPNPTLETIDDTPLWSVATDGSELGSLFPDPTILDNDQLNISDSMSGSLLSSVFEEMTIDLAFSLSPNAVGGVNGNFHIVPTPGVLVALGFGGLLVGTGRRRRH